MLPWGFAGLRIRAARLRLKAEEWLPHEPEEGGSTGPEPAQLLCRALRLAPASYQWFELAAVKPGAPLTLLAMMRMSWEEGWAFLDNQTAIYVSAAELVAALQRFAAAEGVEVCASADKGTILLTRAGAR